jgi:hypothetical protein
MLVAVNIRIWDAVLARPTDAACMVTVLEPGGGVRVARAEALGAGLYGFAGLAAGEYLLLIQPLADTFLPSLTQLRVGGATATATTAAVTTGAAAVVTAHLRPSPQYVPPVHAIALRGTLAFDLAPRRPARWAALFARLPGGPVSWTRSDGRGDFMLVLEPPPAADGASAAARRRPAPTQATVEIHAELPAGPAAAPADDHTRLPRDDGSIVEVKARQPLRATLTPAGLVPGSVVSLNSPHGFDWVVLLARA